MVAFFYCLIGGSILSLIISLISICCGGHSDVSTPPAPTKQDVHVHVHQQEQWPTIAEQFDGRLTNIVKNPFEGIL